MPEAIAARALRAIDERVFPGCVVGTLNRGEKTVLPFGGLIYQIDIGGSIIYDRMTNTVTPHTVYDLASVTKSIPVASLAIELIAAGRFSLAHTAKMFVPELANDYGATIEDLLRYRVRGPRLSELAQRYKTFEEIRTHILEHGFDAPPGERSYGNLPAYILGIVLERVSGQSLAALAQRMFFEPLYMTHATFFPHPHDCAPTEIDNVRGEVRGLPHDESAYVFAKSRRVVGHAGLFSCAEDVLTFCEALFAGAFPAVLDGAQRGLGWQVDEPHWMGEGERFGKNGFTGTSVVCDPARRIALVILSNRTYPHRPADALERESAMNRFRRDIADIVFA